MNAKPLLVAAGVGLVLYELYREYVSAETPAPLTPTGAGASTPTASTPAAATTQPKPATSLAPAPAAPAPLPQVSSTDVLAAVIAAASNDSNFRLVNGELRGAYDRWSYYYNRTAYGMTHPAPGIERGAPGVQRGSTADDFSGSQWWAAVKPYIQSAGLAGIARRRAWGA